MSAPGSYPWENLAPQLPICVMIFGARMPLTGTLHRTLSERRISANSVFGMKLDHNSIMISNLLQTFQKFVTLQKKAPKKGAKQAKNGPKFNFSALTYQNRYKSLEKPWNASGTSNLTSFSQFQKVITLISIDFGAHKQKNSHNWSKKMCQHGPKDIFLGSDNPNVLETCRSVLRLLRDIQSDLFQPYLGRGTFKCWYKAAKNSKCAKYSLFLAQTVQRYKVGSKYLLLHMFIQLD